MTNQERDMLTYFAGQALMGMGTWVPPGDFVDSEGRQIPAHMPSYQRMVQEARAEWAVGQAAALVEKLKERKAL